MGLSDNAVALYPTLCPWRAVLIDVPTSICRYAVGRERIGGVRHHGDEPVKTGVVIGAGVLYDIKSHRICSDWFRCTALKVPSLHRRERGRREREMDGRKERKMKREEGGVKMERGTGGEKRKIHSS